MVLLPAHLAPPLNLLLLALQSAFLALLVKSVVLLVLLVPLACGSMLLLATVSHAVLVMLVLLKIVTRKLFVLLVLTLMKVTVSAQHVNLVLPVLPLLDVVLKLLVTSTLVNQELMLLLVPPPVLHAQLVSPAPQQLQELQSPVLPTPTLLVDKLLVQSAQMVITAMILPFLL